MPNPLMVTSSSFWRALMISAWKAMRKSSASFLVRLRLSAIFSASLALFIYEEVNVRTR